MLIALLCKWTILFHLIVSKIGQVTCRATRLTYWAVFDVVYLWTEARASHMHSKSSTFELCPQRWLLMSQAHATKRAKDLISPVSVPDLCGSRTFSFNWQLGNTLYAYSLHVSFSAAGGRAACELCVCLFCGIVFAHFCSVIPASICFALPCF